MLKIKRAPLPVLAKAVLPSDFDATRYRKWIDLARLDNPKVSVMSFNLLSQHYVWKQVFGSLDQRYLDWNQYRLPLINKTIAQLSCDIMCFQELESNVYHSLWQHNFPLPNYALFYVRKPSPAYWGNKPLDHMDGVGIFINQDRFDVLAHRELVFRDYIMQHKLRFEFTTDFTKRVVLRNTVGLLLKLWDKQTKQVLYVTNTHLYWLPLFNDVKLLQTKLLLNELRRFVASDDPGKYNIVMCGDFNSTPDLLVYNYLEGKPIDVEHSPEFRGKDYGHVFDGEECHDKIRCLLEITPAYKALLQEDCTEKLDFTSFSTTFTAVLDHIWFSSGNFKVCKVLGKVDPEYSGKVQGFPDKQFPSDHIPLVAELSYV